MEYLNSFYLWAQNPDTPLEHTVIVIILFTFGFTFICAAIVDILATWYDTYKFNKLRRKYAENSIRQNWK